MGAVFISYRRGDSEGQARALCNDLAEHVGKDAVFMDVDSIALGRDFRQILQERLETCDMMLALIGPNWLDAKDAAGTRRLDSPTDFVRQEIAAALKRNIPLTPVLVQGAQMPPQERLPEDLKDLAFRNGFELSHLRWESDVREMVKRLGLGRSGIRRRLPEESTASLTDAARSVAGAPGRLADRGAGDSSAAPARVVRPENPGRRFAPILAGAPALIAFVSVAWWFGISGGPESEAPPDPAVLQAEDEDAQPTPFAPGPGNPSGSEPVPPARTLLGVSSAATYSTQGLEPGFEPDPVTIEVDAGGYIEIDALGPDCVGWAAFEPDVMVVFAEAGQMLRFSAEAATDTALAVLDPSDNWHCNDDSQGHDPEVTFEPATSGTYRVWVTTFEGGSADATLHISELPRPRVAER